MSPDHAAAVAFGIVVGTVLGLFLAAVIVFRLRRWVERAAGVLEHAVSGEPMDHDPYRGWEP